jgi:glycerophosphoryl diester phosphodiesterase
MAAGGKSVFFTAKKLVGTEFQTNGMRINSFVRRILVLSASFITLVLLYQVKCFLASPAPNHSYLPADRFFVIAHRGGRSLGPENTLYTFRRAVDAGADVLELDVQITRDGNLVALHDNSVDRTTNATGRVKDYSLADLKGLDAAYRWSPDNDRNYPLRNRRVKIPTLAEVFETCPDTRVNIEIKNTEPDVLPSMCRLIQEYNMSKKVMVASFDAAILKKFRAICPEVATSAGSSEVILFYSLQKMHMESAYSPDAQALQVPEYYGTLRLVNRRFVEAAHARNMKVHVWTINDVDSMKRLLQLGVDGIMTDYPDRLMGLLK